MYLDWRTAANRDGDKGLNKETRILPDLGFDDPFDRRVLGIDLLYFGLDGGIQIKSVLGLGLLLLISGNEWIILGVFDN